MNLIEKVFELCEQAHKFVRDMAKYGISEATAEREYRKLRSQWTLRLRSEGVPATLIKDIVDGETADARFKRDTARVYYKTAQEKINVIKKETDTVNEQIRREYTQ